MKNYKSIVEKVCNQAKTLLNADDGNVRLQAAAKVTRVVAWEIYSQHDTNCGLIRKTGGSQVQNLSVDKLLFKDTTEFVDILAGAGDANGSKPSWLVEKDTRKLTWVKPAEEYFVTPEPVPDPPDDVVDDVITLLTQILAELKKLSTHLGVR